MELELYSALQEAGVSEEKAKAVVESVRKEIDQRYNLHSKQLATQGDVEKVRADVERVRTDLEKVRVEIANAKTEIIKWNIGAIIMAVGLFATIAKIMGA
jgi:multidrug resistance efflux pump